MSRAYQAAKRCPKCLAFLGAPAPRSDGLDGVLYRDCQGCGYSSPVTARKPSRRALADDLARKPLRK